VRFTEQQRELLKALSSIQDAQERFTYIIERGRRQPSLEPQFKTDAFRVEGCLSKLWLVPDVREGKCFFRADSDSLIVRSVAALLCDLCSGHTAEEILSSKPSVLGQIGINQHLTPNRRNALSRLWEKIQEFARAEGTVER
jgi:cysteine desulfuration protein SufE